MISLQNHDYGDTSPSLLHNVVIVLHRLIVHSVWCICSLKRLFGTRNTCSAELSNSVGANIFIFSDALYLTQIGLGIKQAGERPGDPAHMAQQLALLGRQQSLGQQQFSILLLSYS